MVATLTKEDPVGKILILLIFVTANCSPGKFTSPSIPQKPGRDKTKVPSAQDSADLNAEGGDPLFDNGSDNSIQQGAPTTGSKVATASKSKTSAQASSSAPKSDNESTTQPQTCYVDEEANIYIDNSGGAPKEHHYNNLALDLEFNSDAFDFQIALIRVVVDDGQSHIQIGGQQVHENGGSGHASIYEKNVPLNGLLRGSKTLVQANFYDKDGTYAKLQMKLRGTWKTNEKNCFKDFNHRYFL